VGAAERDTEFHAAYVTTYDARDRRQWSGTGTSMARALERAAIGIHLVGPLDLRLARGQRLRGPVRRFTSLGRECPERSPAAGRGYARQIEHRLERVDHDLVFSPGTIPIARLRSRRPIGFWTDATFASMIDFYPGFTGLSRRCLRHGHDLERRALASADIALYSSDWAAQSAIDDYGADPRAVHVVPFGANLEITHTAHDVEGSIRRRPDDRCRLVFIGTDWVRKGGDVAVETATILNDAGMETQLDLVGSVPPTASPAFVRSLGFLSKADGEDAFARMLSSAHFLILPTRADCSPMVLAEASAYGLPSVAPALGGIATTVRDGVNGRLVPAGSNAQAYAEAILALLADRQAYETLARSSFDDYRMRLNWDVAGARASTLIRAATAR
jgi:glycosyltransferase involved in cell wall biosynthesis